MAFKKQILSRSKWIHGLSNDDDKRDIKPTELVEAIDCDVSKGRIRMLGGQTTHALVQANPATITPGYGLFSFSTDRNLAGAETGEDWLAVADVANGEIDLYARTTGWALSKITPYDGAGGAGSWKASYYFSDGILRVSDGNHDSDMRTKWFGFIRRHKFLYNGAVNNYVSYEDSRWFEDYAEPIAPISGIMTSAAPGYPATTNVANWRFQEDASGNGSGWNGKTWWFAYSFVYDNNQESLLYVLGAVAGTPSTIDTSAYAANSGCDITCYVNADDTLANRWNARITHIKLYYRETDGAGVYSDAIWYFYNVWDMAKGIAGGAPFKYSPDGYYRWSGNALMSPHVAYINSIQNNPPTARDFASETGYLGDPHTYGWPDSDDTVQVLFATACTLNRCAYIANVRMYDNTYEFQIYGDRMMKSKVNRFDTFSRSEIIDVNINDGESIIKLVAFSDRILQFKQRTLYIINAAQEFEFREATHKHMGIKTPAAVCETPFGVVWVNNKGLYFYNGERVVNLLYDNTGKLRIDKTEWEAFVIYEEYISIGFYPHLNQLIILKSTYDGAGANYDGDVIVYDLNYNSFVKGDSKFTDSIEKTNFVNDWNGDLVLVEEDGVGTCKIWSPTPATTTKLDIQFVDEIFENEIQRKKIFSVFVTHKNSDANKVKLQVREISSESAAVWTSRVSAGNYSWKDITFADNISLFVAVGYGGSGNNVMTSSDGITWALVAVTDSPWDGVCWAPALSLFVAVAGTGAYSNVMTSPDGATWTNRASDNLNFSAIAWSPTLSILAAVSSSTQGASSTDGITWATRTLPSSGGWGDVCWAEFLSLFITVGSAGATASIATSSNGTSWSAQSHATPGWTSVCSADELGLVVAVGGSKIMISEDAVTWEDIDSPADYEWRKVVWSPGERLLVAVASSGTGNRIMVSKDGRKWTLITSPVDNDWYGLCWANSLNLFAAISIDGTGNRVMTSPGSGDTETWTDLGNFANKSSFGPQEFLVDDIDNIYSTRLRVVPVTGETVPSDFEILSYSIVFLPMDIA